MRVSREVDYGVRAVIVLAASEGHVLSKRTIAEGFDVPINFLAIILPKLVHEGIVESLPGPKGGYRLAKPAKLISMYDVVCAVGENFILNHCQSEPPDCDQKYRCSVSDHWNHIRNQLATYLKGVMFDELAKGYRR
jgi:Rrf2 family protein